MNDPGVTRVAVYIDFDNIVISRYDQVHGRGQFQRDKARGFNRADRSADPDIADKLRRATVDVGAVIDFASSFGTLVLTRAYADWSAPVNADYSGQLISRAVDLVQLFPAAAYAKDGADIRLAVDAVEDMFRLPDRSHCGSRPAAAPAPGGLPDRRPVPPQLRQRAHRRGVQATL